MNLSDRPVGWLPAEAWTIDGDFNLS